MSNKKEAKRKGNQSSFKVFHCFQMHTHAITTVFDPVFFGHLHLSSGSTYAQISDCCSAQPQRSISDEAGSNGGYHLFVEKILHVPPSPWPRAQPQSKRP